MPDEKKLDPFKPLEPTIPGVSPAAKKPVTAPEAPAGKRSAVPSLAWVVTAAVAVVIVAVGLAFYLSRDRKSVV